MNLNGAKAGAAWPKIPDLKCLWMALVLSLLRVVNPIGKSLNTIEILVNLLRWWQLPHTPEWPALTQPKETVPMRKIHTPELKIRLPQTRKARTSPYSKIIRRTGGTFGPFAYGSSGKITLTFDKLIRVKKVSLHIKKLHTQLNLFRQVSSISQRSSGSALPTLLFTHESKQYGELTWTFSVHFSSPCCCQPFTLSEFTAFDSSGN